MSKVIAIGRRADILPFRAAGAELVEVDNAKGAAAAFDSIMEIKDPSVVMVTEDFYDECAREIELFRQRRNRAVLAIPSLAGTPGKRMAAVRSLVARALGVDLLGRDAGS